MTSNDKTNLTIFAAAIAAIALVIGWFTPYKILVQTVLVGGLSVVLIYGMVWVGQKLDALCDWLLTLLGRLMARIWVEASCATTEVLAHARVLMQPATRMNYRIFIPSLIGALLLGALLHWGFAERYRFQAIGGGKMMKTDRWSGKSWMAYGSEWIPVKEPR